jgi:hypothetical protein
LDFNSGITDISEAALRVQQKRGQVVGVSADPR